MVIHLDFGCEVPIYQQIRNAIVKGIADGSLESGEKLPTIRALADEAGINMMTVNKAYKLLREEGYIFTDRRNGATVVKREEGSRMPVPKAAWERLVLAASEAKLAGITETEFVEWCRTVFQELEGER